MKNAGFLLIECSIALLVLALLMGTYGWYLWSSMVLQKEMEAYVRHTTTLSNVLEELYGRKRVYSEGNENNLCVISKVLLPSITGPWASMIHEEKIGYQLIQGQMQWRSPSGKEYSCIWHAGIYV